MKTTTTLVALVHMISFFWRIVFLVALGLLLFFFLPRSCQRKATNPVTTNVTVWISNRFESTTNAVHGSWSRTLKELDEQNALLGNAVARLDALTNRMAGDLETAEAIRKRLDGTWTPQEFRNWATNNYEKWRRDGIDR